MGVFLDVLLDVLLGVLLDVLLDVFQLDKCIFLLSCRQRVTLEEVFRRCSQTFGCLRHNG